MKNKLLQNVSVARILFAVFALTIISLFVSRFFENQHLAKSRAIVSELTEKSIHRQEILIKMRKGIDYVHVNLLRFLFYSDIAKRELAENKMYAEITKNDKNFLEFKNFISDNREQRLFDTLVLLRKEYAKNRSELIQLVKAGKKNEAFLFNDQHVYDSYEKFQEANIILANYCRQRDNNLAENVMRQFSSFEKTRTVINYSLFLVLGVLGLMIARVLKKLRESNLLLTESERKYRTVIERTTEIIQTANQEGKLVAVNNAFKEKMGYNENEITTLTILDILAPESKHLYKPNPLKSEYGEVITGIRKTLQSKTGKKIIVEGNIILNYKNETFESATGFFIDVTEKIMAEKALVASEERYRQLFNFGPVPMWVISPEDLRFIQVNKVAVEQYGYNETEFMNMTLSDITVDIDKSKLTELINNEKKNGFKHHGTYRHTKKSGEEILVDIHVSDVLLNDKWKKLIIALDVTEKNNYEQKLTRAIIKTQEDERYHIGAELHDNVCQILAVTQMTMGMIKKSVPSTAYELFEQADGNIKLATQEIRNLSHQLAPAFFDDTNLHEAFIRLLNSINIEDKYKIKLDFEKKILTETITQEVKLNLYRILQEQLRNILKYANATSINVQVNLKNNFICMQIIDNGIGFDKEKAKGGIGFANMQRRATMFNGKFEVSSSPGNGCKVVIEIPFTNLN